MNDWATSESFGMDVAPQFRIEGDAYIVEFPVAGVAVEVSRVEPSKSEIHGLIRVTSSLPGTREMVHQGRFNLTSTSARSGLVKYLRERLDVADWSEVVEQTCHLVLDALRAGQPVVRMSEIGAREQARFRIDPLIIEGFPTIIFGPGGSGKSLIGMMAAIVVQGDKDLPGVRMSSLQGEVLVCDWELDDVTYKEAAQRLAAGFNVELPNFHYRQCAAPLAEEASSIGRDIARLNISLVIIDSLGYAIGGDKTSQELTMRMFSAIRAWKTTALCIDHVTNDETTGNRPYGSAYTVNSARSLWRVRAEQEDGSNELSIGMFQTKANFGKQPPVGFKVLFDDDATFVNRADIREMPAMRENLSASMRIKTALTDARESLTRDAIAEATGLKESIVKARLSDLVKRGDVVRIDPPKGTNFAAKWALRTDRDEPE